MLKLQQRKRKQVNMDADLWIWNSAGPGAEHGWEAVRSCGVATGPSSSGGWQSVTVNDQLTEANQSRSDLHFAAKILQFYHRNVCGKRPLMVFGAAFPSKPGCHQHVARVVGGLVWLCLRNSWRGHTEFPDVWQKSSEVRYQRLLPQASQGSLGNLKIQCPLVKPCSNHAGQAWDEMLPSVQGSLHGHTRAVPPASHRYHRQVPLSSAQTNTWWWHLQHFAGMFCTFRCHSCCCSCTANTQPRELRTSSAE